LRSGADAESLVNVDVAPRLAALSRGPLGERAVELAETAAGARRAVRGFANKLLTFDVLVDALTAS
jgi:hypothetical protein